MTKKTQKKPRRRTKKWVAERPPRIQAGLAISIIVHAGIVAAIVAATWWPLSLEKPGSALFVDDVIIGDDENTASQSTEKPAVSQQKDPAVATPAPARDEAVTSGPENGPVTTGASGTGGERAGDNAGSGTHGNPVLAEIRQRIERAKRYPEQARAMRQEGHVNVQFQIQPNGSPSHIVILQSSGVTTLDNAARQAIERSAPLPPYTGAINFTLTFRLY